MAAESIQRVVRGVAPHWVGDGFPVRSLFSYAQAESFDPFLLLDFAGPHEFPPTQARRGVGEHPHRGFETVTIVYQGELDHRDSSGSKGTIGPGDVQWMTAASGVVHEEFHSERFARSGGVLEMVQLWVNLPAREKSSAPRYQGLLDADIPRAPLPGGGGTVRVVAGRFEQTPGAARTATPINVWDVALDAAGPVDLAPPEGHTAILVVQSGAVQVEDAPLGAAELVLLDRSGRRVRVRSDAPVRLLVLTGEPIGEPVVGHGPFVMNTRDEIRQAIQDYQQGRMGRLD